MKITGIYVIKQWTGQAMSTIKTFFTASAKAHPKLKVIVVVANTTFVVKQRD